MPVTFHHQANGDDVPNRRGGRAAPRKELAGSEEASPRLFSGVWADLRQRLPYYGSDFTDAANFKCLTSVAFMFFASFAPAMTFGGLMSKYTEGKMGSMETLFAQCICGVLWGLFSAQPLLIMSPTGPVLLFEASLYDFCSHFQLDFLVVRLYAGVWVLFIALCVVAFDGSRLLSYVTRFSEDIFAALISSILIAESLHFLWTSFRENPVGDYTFYHDAYLRCLAIRHPDSNAVYQNHFGNNQSTAIVQHLSIAALDADCLSSGVPEPNTALLNAFIVLATFLLAYMLRMLRSSIYLGGNLRRVVGDFGVLIAVATVAPLVHLLIPHARLDRLNIPAEVGFTNATARGHGWLVNPWGVETNVSGGASALSEPQHSWMVDALLVAPFGSLLLFILLFVETGITELLLLRPERCCRKGGGRSWDLLLVAICVALCSALGLPWMCAAAVQSIAHCSSLTVMRKRDMSARRESTVAAPMEIDHVIEQRVTTIAIALLIGAVSLCGPWLDWLPLASLFGVFLYLGVMNLIGVQLTRRVVLLFVPRKYHDPEDDDGSVELWRLHLYTLIQMSCLCVIFAVKNFKRTALAFPFLLLTFVAVRWWLMPLVFTASELESLDEQMVIDVGEEGEEEAMATKAERKKSKWMEKSFTFDDSQVPV